MVSMWFLDYADWWTVFGNVIKYALLLIAVGIGIAIFIRSKLTYFGAGWIPVVAAPLFIIAVVEQILGKSVIFRLDGPKHEQGFIYLWMGLIFVEFFLIWIPLLALAFRASLATLPTTKPQRTDGA